MKISRYLFWISLIGASGLRAADEIPSFLKLKDGLRIEVAFQSSGCFYTSKHRFEFSGGKARIFELQPVFELEKTREKPVDGKLLGELSLQDEDLKGLDRLFAFYENPPDGGCTTVDNITVTFYQGEKTVFAGKYVDETCASRKDASRLTFWKLIQRLEKSEVSLP